MKALLLSKASQDQAFFKTVAAGAQLPIEPVADAAAACEQIAKDPATIVIVDASSEQQYRDFEGAIAEKIGLFSGTVNPNHYFFVGSQGLQEAPYLTNGEVFGHFIHRSFTDADLRPVTALFQSCAAERAFGIEQFFSPEAKIQTIKITQSLQKRVLVERLRDHLVEIGFKARMATSISDATDELVMNGIFDAPVDVTGKHTKTTTPRNAAFELTDREIVDLKVAFDGTLMGISVTDYFGSLDKKKLLTQHIGKSYVAQDYEARSTSAGAGLGLAHVFRNCGGMLFSCEVGEKTEATVFFKRLDSFKEFKDQFRFLSTFMYFS